MYHGKTRPPSFRFLQNLSIGSYRTYPLALIMPPIEAFHRHQKAVLWPTIGVSSYGQYKVSLTNRVELKVRWEDVQRTALDPLGNTIATDATVVVDRNIAIGSIMWLGGLNDIPGTSFIPESGLYQVKLFDATPDLKNRHTRHVVQLMRFNDSLPI